MKVPSSYQSLILANERPGFRAKNGSVFDAALGPAARRASTQRQTIIASPADRAVVDDSSDNSPSVGSQQLSDAAGEAATSLGQLTTRDSPTPALQKELTDGIRFRNPVELYAQTQRISSNAGSRQSVYLDVHA